jgi:hypothetical protein
MRKIFIPFLAIVLLTGFLSISKKSRADEGMWLPLLIERLNYADMQKIGLKLSTEEIYSVNKSSLKDAIVQLGNGCTGEIISDQGLILTNHHCGYGKIQAHSTVEHDYLTDGFWAKSFKEELPNPGFFVKFLVRIEDVTSKVLVDVKEGMNEEERAKIIKENIGKLKASTEEGTHYDAVIKPFFSGNEYYMFVMETYNDVRLVGAPPSAIGKFGGETDNWMWPRHTGDFSLFRVYSSPDGKPADYSPDNIPLKPKHFLPISIQGVQNDDFAMILGYPGSTDRYLSSYGVEFNLNHVYPTRIKVRRKKLDIIGADMKSDDAIRIKYASKYARISNYWKNFIGMSRGLKKLNVADKKRATENRMNQWINEYESRKEKYGTVLKDIEGAYAEMAKYAMERYYYYEGVGRGIEVFQLANYAQYLETYLKSDKADEKKIENLKTRILKASKGFYKDYNPETDHKLFVALLEMYQQNVPAEQQADLFIDLAKKYKNDFSKMQKKLFAKSVLADSATFHAFVKNPDVKKLEKDMLYQLALAINKKHEELNKLYQQASSKLQKANRLYIDALRKMDKDKSFYPDANFTMRLSYGQVKNYSPADGVIYKHYTTLDGIIEKEDPSNDEFIVPKKLKEIWQDKNYGPYAKGGHMNVAILTNNDITGGNSGSPVINGKGELIGLAFDGNWEAMSGDIAFEPELQRTISVDIRYVLLIMDKYANAQNLISELKIVGGTDK